MTTDIKVGDYVEATVSFGSYSSIGQGMVTRVRSGDSTFFMVSDLGKHGFHSWACNNNLYHRHLSVDEIVVLKLQGKVRYE